MPWFEGSFTHLHPNLWISEAIFSCKGLWTKSLASVPATLLTPWPCCVAMSLSRRASSSVYLSKVWLKLGKGTTPSDTVVVNKVHSWTGVVQLPWVWYLCSLSCMKNFLLLYHISTPSSGKLWLWVFLFTDFCNTSFEGNQNVKPRGTIEVNADVLIVAAEKWVEVFDFHGSGQRPRTIPLQLLVEQVPCWKNTL